MYQDILVPTDGSESMGNVLDHTIEIASGRDAMIHVLYVIDDQAFLTLEDGMKDDVLEDLRQEGETAVGDIASELEAEDIEATTRITKGRPSDEIISYVEQEDIDFVTMGTRAGEYTNNILGSTAQKVVTDAPVPVMTVNVASE
jgi:nucleotide-binding universal stress UspA family protein